MYSMLDTDFYKFSMMQAVLHQYSGTNVKYSFKWRNWKDMHLKISTEKFVEKLKERIQDLCELKFTKQELQYLSQIKFFKPDFIEYLRLFKFNIEHINIYIENGEIKIDITGPWISTILFEVPVLAIVSELYTENQDINKNWFGDGCKNLEKKVKLLKDVFTNKHNFKFADFGTRRRASIGFHEQIIHYIKNEVPNMFVGTSNMYYAKKYDLLTIGTMAHEYICAHQQLGSRLIDSQTAALQSWANEYRGELGIALSDSLGFDMFLKDFDRYFALLFDGCRHDSGDPTKWCNKLIEHYKKLKINPKTKTAVFSDGLNFIKAISLYNKFNDKINTSFGIGTYLTNDVGFKAPQIVIKLIKVNEKPVAKISDDPGKGMCTDESFLKYLTEVVTEKINLE